MKKNVKKIKMFLSKRFLSLFIFNFVLFHFAYSVSNLTISPKNINIGGNLWLTVNADVISGGDLEIILYWDFNGNGIKDAEDSLFRRNILKEGVPPLTTGSPIPGDEDGQNGHILTRLDFLDEPIFAGNYILIVKDNNGEAQDSFVINQPSYSQHVIGTLRNESGNPILGIVLAFAKENIHGVLTNQEGTYNLSLPVGNITLLGMSINLLSDSSRNSYKDISLAANETKNNIDLTLYNANYTISGRVINTLTSSPVSNVLIHGGVEESSPNLNSLTYSDADGYFHLPVNNGLWRVEVAFSSHLGFINDKTTGNININNASLNDQNLNLIAATTYIKGNITRKSDGLPLFGLSVYAQTENNQYEQYGFSTYPDGTFVLPVVPGKWFVNLNEDNVINAGYVVPPSQIAYPTVSQPAIGINFQLEQPSATINVNVKEKNTSNNISGLNVWLSDNNWQGQGSRETDEQGNCSFAVSPGNYFVGIDSNSLAEKGYITSVQSQNIIIAEGETKQLNFEVQKGGAKIQGYLMHNGSPVQDVNISLWGNDWNFQGSVRTNSSGFYLFPVLAGSYYIGPSGDDLVARNLVPVVPKTTTISSGETQTLNFDILSPTAILNINIQGGDIPLKDIGVSINNDQNMQMVYLKTNSDGKASVGMTAGTYIVSLSYDDVIKLNFLPQSNKTFSLTDGQTLNINYNLHPFTPQTTSDVILGKFSPDNSESYYLDRNHDGKIDISDLILLIISGNSGK